MSIKSTEKFITQETSERGEALSDLFYNLHYGLLSTPLPDAGIGNDEKAALRLAERRLIATIYQKTGLTPIIHSMFRRVVAHLWEDVEKDIITPEDFRIISKQLRKLLYP